MLRIKPSNSAKKQIKMKQMKIWWTDKLLQKIKTVTNIKDKKELLIVQSDQLRSTNRCNNDLPCLIIRQNFETHKAYMFMTW